MRSVRSLVERATANQSLLEFLRYGITGGAGLVLNLACLTLLVEVGGLPEEFAAVISVTLALLATFLSTERWVFTSYSASQQDTVLRRAPMYYVTMIAGKGVNYVIYLALIGAGVWYPLSWALGSVLVFFGTFLTNRYIWRRTASAPA